MNEDVKNELELLQEQLSKNDEWFEKELDSAKRMIGQMPEKPRTAAASANNRPVAAPRNDRSASDAAPKAVPVYNTTVGPVQQELVFENTETEEPSLPQKGTKRLWALVGLEILGILGVAAYWLLFILR